MSVVLSTEWRPCKTKEGLDGVTSNTMPDTKEIAFDQKVAFLAYFTLRKHTKVGLDPYCPRMLLFPRVSWTPKSW